MYISGLHLRFMETDRHPCTPLKLKLFHAIDIVGLLGIVFGKQNLGRTFNFDQQDNIDFTKFSKLTMSHCGTLAPMSTYTLLEEKKGLSNYS
jgi:hypothetical protein